MSESEVDWTEARSFLSRRLRILESRLSPDQIDDLAQEASVRLMRVLRREAIDNLEAFMTTLAKRVWIDHLRKRRTWGQIFSEADDESPEPAASNPGPGDDWGGPLDRIAWVVCSFFEARNAPCAELATYYFADVNWNRAAEKLSRSYAAVRQQWVRCVKLLTASLTDQQGPLWEWAVAEGLNVP